MEHTYFKKKKGNYNKGVKINTSKRRMNELLEGNLGDDAKRVGLQRVFNSPDFKNFVNDVKRRVQKLNREYAIQQVNYSNSEIPEEIGTLANALNDYTNDLVGFYEKSYFNMSNENKRKRFIRDLKMIIGTYGELEESLHNIIYNREKKVIM